MSETDVNSSDLDAALIQDDDPFTGAPEPESTQDEPEKPVAEEPSEPVEEQPVTDEEEDPVKETPPEEETDEPVDEPQSPEEERKRYNDEKARERIANRELRRQQEQALQTVKQNYSPTTEEQFVEQGYNEADARVLALQEEMRYERQANQVAQLDSSVKQDIKDVERDFDVFNPNSKDYDQKFAEKVTRQWATAARYQTDANGLVLNAELPPYEFFKDAAEMYGHVQVQSSQAGKEQGQAAALRMVAKAESPNGASQTTTPSNDPVLDELLKD